ncbi:hypothetical protein JHD50_05300 [Sulfurimonas sp. MAG313]|nr:hypothetical protein [Sulfurimonas sp. MAG313]MDF1880725.1 hypothetical protein [Sulfurimonas sp. MAG313]
METALLPPMSDLPGLENIQKVIIDANVINDGAKPEFIMKKNEKVPSKKIAKG